MSMMPTVGNTVTWFNAKAVAPHRDAVDRQTASIVDTRTAEGSTVQFYNADGFEFMTLKSDGVGTRVDSILGEKLVGTRHAGDGRLYAILKDSDGIHEEAVGLLPFADVQAGPNCEFGCRITAVVMEYGPADVTVSLRSQFAELVTATRPYTASEADYLL